MLTNYPPECKAWVGIQYNGGKTVFYDCPSGKEDASSLDKGNGSTPYPYRKLLWYVLSVGRVQVQNVATVKDTATLVCFLHLHLRFSSLQGGDVSAAELCRNAKTG